MEERAILLRVRPGPYFRASAVGLLALAAAGVVAGASNHPDALAPWLRFDWTHTTGHVMLGLLALLFGHANLSRRVLAIAALAIGSGYFALGAAGVVDPEAVVLTGMDLHLEPVENIAHLLVGGLGVVAGITSWPRRTPPATS